MNRYSTYYGKKKLQFLLLCIAGSVCCSLRNLGSCSIMYCLYDAKFPWHGKESCIIDFKGILLDNDAPDVAYSNGSETQSNLLCSQLCSYHIISTQTRIHLLSDWIYLHKPKLHVSLKTKQTCNTSSPFFLEDHITISKLWMWIVLTVRRNLFLLNWMKIHVDIIKWNQWTLTVAGEWFRVLLSAE